MKHFLGIIVIFTSLQLAAQVDTTANQGEIVMGEVVIEKEKSIILPLRDKRYQRASTREFDKEPLDLTLSIKEPELTWPPYKSDVSFQHVSKTYPESSYQNYLRLGYGNYGSPLAEIGVFQKLGAFQTSNKVFYESFQSGPVNDEDSGNSLGSIDLSATYKVEDFQITPQLRFVNNQYRFYGNTNRSNSTFTTSRFPDINFSNLNFNINLEGKKGDFEYYVIPKVDASNQKISSGESINKESVLGSDAGIKFNIDERVKTGFDLQGYSSSYSSGIGYDRSLFSLKPWVTYRVENLAITGGFNLATGKSGDVNQSGFYPDIDAEWEFTDKWILYGELSGNVEWNGLNELLNENEFLDDSLVIRNIENSLRFGGGLKGSPIKNLLVDASLKLSNQNNLPFFVPSSSDSSRFVITYDEEAVNRVTFNTSVSYAPTTTSLYKASLELNSYSVTTLDRPWHLPTYVFRLNSSHNIKQKLLFSTRLIAMGGIKAPANVDFGIVNLTSFIDVGVDLKYLITERASVWLEVNNIGNNSYERYLGYPLRAINFKIGGQYRF